ncbi:hypothetical protein [Prevotella intermedia]|uniref:hypothetical protein n=1 Tax=Prevotella intermedia TaxID=28131 RepID=UPI0012DA07F5|nr:hypothetical protein [Prevotella intermedia]
MKKIILSMAMLAMVGATATAQKNNDGLTPSRPLTSGELFQGMSRAPWWEQQPQHRKTMMV